MPPGVHRINAAEREVQTWNNHFISGLFSTGPNFPMHLLCSLIKKYTFTLNLLRQCRHNPRISAYTALEVTLGFNKTTLAPSGYKVVIDENADAKRTWAPNGSVGWYIGPAMDR